MRGTPVRFTDFTGGVNTKSAPYLVAENECRDCLNVVSTVRGSIKKRNGNLTFCSTFTGTPANLFSLFPLNVGATVLIATGGTKVYSISTGGVSSDITGAASITSNLRWSFIAAPTSGGQGPLYGMNGTDTPKYWTGAGNIADWTASVGSVPNGKYMQYFKNRVWVAGTTSNPSRLYFSDLGDPRSWTATNVVDFDPNDGGSITGLGTIGPYLLVFKETKTYLVYDLDTGANRTLSVSVGCVANRSIVETPVGTFFLTADKGVYVTDGRDLRLVSEKITPTVQNIVAANRQNAAGAFTNDHYYLSISTTGTTNNLTLDYDTTTKSWWFHSNNANQYVLWKAGSAYELYGVQAGAAIVDKNYVSNTFQDNGASFTASWTGPWLTFKEPYRNKRVRQIRFDGRGSWDFNFGKNFLGTLFLVKSNLFAGFGSVGSTFGGGDTFGGGGTFGDPNFQGNNNVYSLGVGRSFSVQLQSADANDGEIDSYTTLITPRTN